MTVAQSAPAMARSNGIELCYDTFGDHKAPPLLLIMGLGAQMIAWDEAFCAELASRGYWVIRFDNRDIGKSTHLSAAGIPDPAAMFTGGKFDAPYLLADMAKDTIGLIDVLGIGKAHLVGASMGGMIAQTLAIRHPDRVKTLTSIMSSTGEPGLPPPSPEALLVLMSPTPLDWDGYAKRYVKTWTVLRAGSFPLDEARDLVRARAAFDRGLNPPGVARQLAAVVASGSRKEALAAVRAPTLVIHGDADPLVPLEAGKATARAVPGAKLTIVKGMGHALPISQWPQIIDAIAAHAR